MEQNTKADRLSSLIPKRAKHDKKDLTDFYPKDKYFNRKKTYTPNSNQVKEVNVNYRKVCVSNNHLILFKGEALTKVELSYFSDDEKKSWLEQKKKSSKKSTD